MPHIVELIAVGTELLLGNIVNSDAQLLSRELSALGLNVYYHTVVGDNPKRLRQAVNHAKKRADIIITTGGLGPTCDDVTKTVLAAACGKKLELHRESAQRIVDYFETLGQKMTSNNMNQAMLPEGCEIFTNQWGTAPGCAFEYENKHIIMLPGPPSECLPMFRTCVVSYLQKLSEGMIVSHTYRVFGMGESRVESLLRGAMDRLTNPTLAPYAKTGEVELRITAKANTPEQAEQMIQPVEEEIYQVLGNLIYGKDVENLESVLVSLLIQHGLTLGCAESCTGGLFAKRITDVPGSSRIFKGGIVSYCNEVKANLLGVDPAMLETDGAVSSTVAQAMAKGAREALGCDLAISFTGVAGPGPDDRGNPEGLVYICLASQSTLWTKKFSLGSGRERIRTTAVSYGLDMIRRRILNLGEPDV